MRRIFRQRGIERPGCPWDGHAPGKQNLFWDDRPAVETLVGIVILLQDSSFERYPSKEPTRTRIAQNLGVKLEIGSPLRFPAHRPSGGRSVGAELDTALYQLLGALGVHHDKHNVRGLTAQLEAEA